MRKNIKVFLSHLLGENCGVGVLKELRNSFSCSDEEFLGTVKEWWIRVVFIDVYHIDCIMQDNEAIIGAYIDNWCDYRVIIGGILLRLQCTNYGGGYTNIGMITRLQ